VIKFSTDSCSKPHWTVHQSQTNLPIPDISLAERKVNINLNGRQAIPTGQPNNPTADKYPYATSGPTSVPARWPRDISYALTTSSRKFLAPTHTKPFRPAFRTCYSTLSLTVLLLNTPRNTRRTSNRRPGSGADASTSRQSGTTFKRLTWTRAVLPSNSLTAEYPTAECRSVMR
jgi:hypothetical protein